MNNVQNLFRAMGCTWDETKNKLNIPHETPEKNKLDNPAASLIELLAYVMDVNISELSDLETDKDELFGIVIYRKKTYRINNRNALNQLYQDVQSDQIPINHYY